MKRIASQLKTALSSITPKRLFCSLLVLASLAGLLSTAVFAAWDGQGTNGDENTGSVTGDFSLPYADEDAILGYRFSVYDSEGNKLGYSVDIDRKTHSYDTLYRSYNKWKMSHIDLYKAYSVYSNHPHPIGWE